MLTPKSSTLLQQAGIICLMAICGIQKHDEWFAAMRDGLARSDHKKFCYAAKNLFRLIGWEAEIRDHHQGDTDVIASVAVDGKHYLLVVRERLNPARRSRFP